MSPNTESLNETQEEPVYRFATHLIGLMRDGPQFWDLNSRASFLVDNYKDNRSVIIFKEQRMMGNLPCHSSVGATIENLDYCQATNSTICGAPTQAPSPRTPLPRRRLYPPLYTPLLHLHFPKALPSLRPSTQVQSLSPPLWRQQI